MAADVVAHDGLPNLRFDPAADPDAQATVNDFIDYTELFPSDMIRSLTLIGKLDEIAKEQIIKVHELLRVYGALPTMPPADRPDSVELRAQISKALGRATSCRQAAASEADRLHLTSERLCNRLTIIKTKLQALPKPPSRDPTPQPTSPLNTRSRRQEYQPTPRLTLHLDKARHTSQKAQKKKVLVPGEPLPSGPEEAYSTEESSDDDFAVQTRSSSMNIGADAPDQATRGGRAGRVKIPKIPKASTLKVPKTPKTRPPGVMGTNVHSSIAGISTSNALAKLTPPPQDAKAGSRWRPWLKLTEYEMATLRKSMKKNAVWTPSDTMIRRELAKDGRGRENFEKAKEHAAATGNALSKYPSISNRLTGYYIGEQFLDEDPVDISKATLAPGEVSWDQANSTETVNRGMKLNEAKKQKKEKERELARENDQLEEVGRKMHLVGDQFKTLFSRDSPLAPSPLSGHSRELPKSARKRKRDSDKQSAATDASGVSPNGPESPGPKKLKIGLSSAVKIAPKLAPGPAGRSSSPPKAQTATMTVQIPLAPTGASSSPKSSSAASRRTGTPTVSPPDPKRRVGTPTPATAAVSRSRRGSAKAEARPSTPKDTGSGASARAQPSRPSASGKAASAEPPSRKAEPRELRELRRASVVDVAETLAPRAARRARRPTPGLVTADEDGKRTVSVGTRKAAPKRKALGGAQKGVAGAAAATADRLAALTEDPDWADVDPDEPTYCLCNRVSFGTMIACENDEVSAVAGPIGLEIGCCGWTSLANLRCSAIASGFTSSAWVWRRFLPDEPNGIVRIAGRGSALMRRAILLRPLISGVRGGANSLVGRRSRCMVLSRLSFTKNNI